MFLDGGGRLSKNSQQNMRAAERKIATYASQPIPSPSLSKPCGSGDKTVKPFCGISGQFKSGGADGIQKSGYDESQSPVVAGRFNFVVERFKLGRVTPYLTKFFIHRIQDICKVNDMPKTVFVKKSINRRVILTRWQ